MVEKVLVPVDGSELAARVLAPVGKLLEGSGRLILMRIVPERPPAEEEALLDDAQAALNELAESLAGTGLAVETRLEHGDPATLILEAAERERVDLVAMSTHGRTGVSRLVRGSVAERVLRRCSSPVLLCTPAALEADRVAGGFARILVPLDGSELSAAVLPHVERLSRAYGSSVTLLRVEPFVPSTVPSPLVLRDSWDPAALEATLAPYRERLAEAGVDVTVRATLGIEAVEILAAAEQADLVAMTTHGRSGLSRWWFGSVAEQVLRHCARPLLVVRSSE